jgi:hypothetical protein
MNTSQVEYTMHRYRLSNYGASQSMVTIAHHIAQYELTGEELKKGMRIE